MCMYVLRVCVDVIYVEYVLMCVPECLSMKYVPYLILMAFGRHFLWCISKRARAHTHTHTHICTHRHILLRMLIFDLDVGRAIEKFRWVTALRALNFDTCQWKHSRSFSHYRRWTSCLCPLCRRKKGLYLPAGRLMSSGNFTPNSQTSSTWLLTSNTELPRHTMYFVCIPGVWRGICHNTGEIYLI
jgi:hypothetical protein